MSKQNTLFFITLSYFILFLTFSCKKTIDVNNDLSHDIIQNDFKITSKDINQIKFTEFALSDLSETHTNDWLKFQELKEEIEILKKGDLSFFKDDRAILQSFITDLKNEIPEVLNIPSILVRLSVLETTMFKLEGTSNINAVKKELLLNSIKDVLVAYSNVILQMNKKFEKDSQYIQKPN